MFNYYKKSKLTLEILLITCLSVSLVSCELQKQTTPSSTVVATQKLSPSPQAVCQDFMRYAEINKTGRYLCREGYVVSYNDYTKQPNWVAYRLTPQFIANKSNRNANFAPDLSIPKAYRAELSDYKGSGYDRGHLAPCAAMSCSSKSAAESFLLSNISPQKTGLNCHGWAQLEKYVRFWTRAKGELYVYTGVIYKNKKPRTFIGKSKVAVPDYFYKIIYAPKQKESIAFVMPNTKVDKKNVAKYRISIKEIQERSGFNFFVQLPEKERDQLINKVSTMWRTTYKK